ncbi:MAG: hypothetical protein D6701_11320, partial [Gemmatimonadetes bacterium]
MTGMSGGGRAALRRAVCLAGTLYAAGACAKPGMPPGGPEDRLPPQVVATEPDTFAVLPGRFAGSVRIRFNERISERTTGGSLDNAVVVSPRTGRVRVRHGRDALEVNVAGGFPAGRVYRVTVLPVIRDMFNNTMADPFELVFSTGPAPVPTTIAGLVSDRLTGQPVEGATVTAVAAADSAAAVHVAVTDSAGVYALRYLPEGRYELTAFVDVNRNGEPDFREPADGSVGLVGPGDTLLLALRVLPPDTTPARLTGAEVLGPDAVRVALDDYLDPDDPLTGVRVTRVAPDSSAEAALAVLHEHAYADFARARRDSIAQARRDSLRAAGDPIAAAPPDTAAAGPGAGGAPPAAVSEERAEPLPGRSLVAVFADTLAFDVVYR